MLITDRNISDVDYAILYMNDVKIGDEKPLTNILKGCYNINDINRVIKYVKELNNILISNYSINLNLENMEQVQLNDNVLTIHFYNKYLRNINKICSFTKLNEVSTVTDFNSVNFIERSLLELQKVININTNTFNRLNAINAGGA